MEFQRILILAPHTDDGEIGCGGSIARFVEEGKQVYYAAFSTAQTSVREGFPKNILEIEVKKAVEMLQIPKDNLILYNFEVRRFPDVRQEILHELIKLRAEIKPDLIFLPSLNDIHQDHSVVAQEGLRAFKKQPILGYEQPWNNIVFETRSFIPLEKKHIEKKIQALMCYESQKHRSYLNEEFIWGLARTRGTQIEGNYAEAFEVLRWVFR